MQIEDDFSLFGACVHHLSKKKEKRKKIGAKSVLLAPKTEGVDHFAPPPFLSPPSISDEIGFSGVTIKKMGRNVLQRQSCMSSLSSSSSTFLSPNRPFLYFSEASNTRAACCPPTDFCRTSIPNKPKSIL